MRTYAIGDIHGQLEMLTQAHRRIARDRALCRDRTAPVVHLGDLVDRGPRARGVIEFLLRGIAEGHPWLAIKGNHDRMFAGFLADPDHHDPRLWSELTWLGPRLGGEQTLASYGVHLAEFADRRAAHAAARLAVPPAHRAFLEDLPLTIERGGVLFVHAGLRPGVPLDAQAEDDLVWIRDEFLTDTRDHGRLVVHGHTVVEAPTHAGNRVALDTGAGYGKPLTVAVIEDDEVHILTDAGRVPLRPAAPLP